MYHGMDNVPIYRDLMSDPLGQHGFDEKERQGESAPVMPVVCISLERGVCPEDDTVA